MTNQEHGALLLATGDDGRRAALLLPVGARAARVEAVYPAAGGPLEVAAVDGRVMAARSLSGLLGWPEGPERWALLAPDSVGAPGVCLLAPAFAGVVGGARLEATADAAGTGRRLWWRDGAGAIVEALDVAPLLGWGPGPGLAGSAAGPGGVPQWASLCVVCHDSTVFNLPLDAALRALPAGRCPPLLTRRPAGGGWRVVAGAGALPASGRQRRGYYLFLRDSRLAVYAPRLRLSCDAPAAVEQRVDRRRLVGRTAGWLPTDFTAEGAAS